MRDVKIYNDIQYKSYNDKTNILKIIPTHGETVTKTKKSTPRKKCDLMPSQDVDCIAFTKRKLSNNMVMEFFYNFIIE